MSLSKKRKLIYKLLKDNDDLLGTDLRDFIFDMIIKQDKEAIKELKDEMCKRPIKNKPCDICINCKNINGVFGSELVE